MGQIGTALAQQHLRNVLPYLDVPTMNAAEVFLQVREGFFDADGYIGTKSKGFLHGWMVRYVAWVKQHAG